MLRGKPKPETGNLPASGGPESNPKEGYPLDFNKHKKKMRRPKPRLCPNRQISHDYRVGKRVLDPFSGPANIYFPRAARLDRYFASA